jgi:TolB-like protein/tetratricopeptide (TPR) repeat protein
VAASGSGTAAAARTALPRAAARRSWPGRTFAAVAVLVVAAVVLSQFGERPRPTAVTTSTRIIVLPFSDRSGDSALASLAGALTETLARDLAQSQPLDVVSPTGIALMRERGVTDDSVGRLLSADYLVSGSIASGPDWVRVGVELLDGRTGSLIRSDVIERSREESRILVDDVITRTAGILRREVGNQVEVRRVRASTASEEAWRAVLEARALQEPIVRLIRYRDYDGFERTMERSDSLLTRAGELDRRWAEPLVLRGWLMERRAFVSLFRTPADTASRRKLLEAAASLADRATERDPRDPRAYELRGTVQHQLALLPGAPREVVRDRLTAAEEELRRATQLDPNSTGSWLRLAELLRVSGRYAAAKNAAERAYRIDRYVGEANSIIMVLFSTSLELGEDEEAARWCAEGRKTFERQLPFLYCEFALHAWADRIPPDPARLRRELQTYQESQAVVQPELLARLETLLAAAHARAGERDSARALLRRTADVQGDPALLWMRAGALSSLGEHDEALKSLEAYLARDNWEAHIVGQSRPFWRMRSRTDYQRLVQF